MLGHGLTCFRLLCGLPLGTRKEGETTTVIFYPVLLGQNGDPCTQADGAELAVSTSQ